MTFSSRLKQTAGVKILRSFELPLDSGTVIYSVEGHSASAAYWDDLILDIEPIVRAIDIERYDIITNETKVTLNNADNSVSTLYDDLTEGISGTIKLHALDTDGSILTETEFVGNSRISTCDNDQLNISMDQVMIDDMGILQRSIDLIAFPHAPDAYVGQGQNIIVGSAAASDSDNGAVWLPIVHATNRKLGVAQHVCKTGTIANVIKVKGDAITALATPANYSITLVDTDGANNEYTSITVDAGSWDVDATYYCDASGLENVGNGTGTLYENPAEIIEQVILLFSQLSAANINAASFAAYAVICTARGYDTAGEFGGVVTSGQNGQITTDTLTLLKELAMSCDACLYIDKDGKIAITGADVSEFDTGSLTDITQEDMLRDNEIVYTRSSTAINSARIRYNRASRIQDYESYLQAEDEGSQAALGHVYEWEIFLKYVRGTDTAKDIASRLLLRRGGKTDKCEFSVTGFQHIAEDVGDNITITHPHMLDGLNKKQFMITGKETNLMNCTEKIICYSRGDVWGPIMFSGEETTTYTASVDTWINVNLPNTAYGSTTTLLHTGNSINLIGFSRACLRFDMTTIAAGTVTGATLKVYANEYSNSSSFRLFQLNSTTWSAASTWNTFDGGGGWSEAYILSATLMAPALGGGNGYKSFVFNADGIAYLNSVLGGTNLVEFTFGSMNNTEYITLASAEDSDTNRRPQLIVTYTT